MRQTGAGQGRVRRSAGAAAQIPLLQCKPVGGTAAAGSYGQQPQQIGELGPGPRQFGANPALAFTPADDPHSGVRAPSAVPVHSGAAVGSGGYPVEPDPAGRTAASGDAPPRAPTWRQIDILPAIAGGEGSRELGAALPRDQIPPMEQPMVAATGLGSDPTLERHCATQAALVPVRGTGPNPATRGEPGETTSDQFSVEILACGSPLVPCGSSSSSK